MQFSKKLIEEILMFDYADEDFDNSMRSSVPITSIMSRKLHKAIQENKIQEPVIQIVSRAVALYIETMLKNHPENIDIMYYFFHDFVIIDNTCSRSWSVDAKSLYNKFVEYVKIHFEDIEKIYEYEDFILYALDRFKTIKLTNQKEKDILLHIRYRI